MVKTTQSVRQCRSSVAHGLARIEIFCAISPQKASALAARALVSRDVTKRQQNPSASALRRISNDWKRGGLWDSLTKQRLEEATLEDLDDALDGVAKRFVLWLRQLCVVRLQQLQRSVRICNDIKQTLSPLFVLQCLQHNLWVITEYNWALLVVL